METEKTGLRYLFLGLGGTQCSIAMTVLAETQGAHFYFKIKEMLGLSFIKGTPDAIVSLWGILLLSIFIILTSNTIIDHAKLESGTWIEKLPFRIKGISPSSSVGKPFTIAIFIFFILLPIWSLGHSWNVMQNEGVLCKASPNSPLKKLPEDPLTLWKKPPNIRFSDLFKNKFRLGGEDECDNKTTTFFPLVQPLLFAILTLFAVHKFFISIKHLFFRKQLS